MGITIPESDRTVLVTATAGQTVLSFDFPILAAADLTILKLPAGGLVGSETTLTPGADYTAPTPGVQNGGSVTLTTPASAGDRYVLVGDRSIERLTDLGPYELDSEDLNGELDAVFVHLQEQRREFGRSLRSSPFGNVLDAGGRVIANVGAAVSANEVPTLGQIDAALSANASQPLRGDGYTLLAAGATGVEVSDGQVRFDADLASATRLAIAKRNGDGADFGAWLRTFADSTSSVKGRVRLHAGTSWIECGVTAVAERGADFLLTVQGAHAVGTVTIGADLLLVFVPAGDAGTAQYVGMPVGATFPYWEEGNPPAGCIFIGTSFLETDWPQLALFYQARGFPYGVSGTAPNRTIFTPRVRGRHIRVLDEGAGVELNAAGRQNRGDGTTGDKPGTTTGDAIKAHDHGPGNFQTAGAGLHDHTLDDFRLVASASAQGYAAGGDTGFVATAFNRTTTQAPNHSHAVGSGRSETVGGSENIVKSITCRIAIVADAAAFAAANIVVPFAESYGVAAGFGAATAGTVRFDSETASAVTRIRISRSTSHNLAIGPWLESWDAGRLRIVRPDDPTGWRVYRIVGVTPHAGDVELTVQHVAGTAPLGGSKPVLLTHQPAGADADRFTWRGVWSSGQVMAVDDVVRAASGNLYLATAAHTSGASTEPGVGASWATVWDLWLQKGQDGADGADGAPGQDGADGAPGAPGAPGQDGADGADGVGVPAGGSTGQVLAKASGTDYDTEWVAQSGGSGYVPFAKRARVNHSAGTTAADGVSTLIPWGAEVYDLGDFYNPASTTRLTVPDTGLYLFWAFLQYTGPNGSSNFMQLDQFSSAGTGLLTAFAPMGAFGFTAFSPIQATAGDYFELRFQHNSGATRTLLTDGRVHFAVARVA